MSGPKRVEGYQRTKGGSFVNIMNGEKSITFNREYFLSSEDGKTTVCDAGSVKAVLSDPTNSFPEIDPITEQPTGNTLTDWQLYTMLFSKDRAMDSQE